MSAERFDQDVFDFQSEPNLLNFTGPRPRKEQYNNAYGNYRGGYRAGLGYRRGMPPQLMSFPVPPCNFFGPPGPLGPPGPPGPPIPFFCPRPMNIYGRNIQAISAEEKAIRFLLRCGITRESSKNIPKDILRMIEPTRCRLCKIKFENFTMSRLHYLSKNHAKKQKKYLALKPNLVTYKTKEPPFKSRDLYCELCDVHITSKLHADSHYAGKPHRTIVEGRRPPKNPLFLQPGMQNRVDQLIRREKRSLKAESAKTTVEAKELKPKSFDPDFYCDICKTSVTCTEQMTMHLNGKKHLAKEKQHILNMMKGEEPKENADQDIKKEDVENDGEDVADDDADWENGGEKWE